MRRLPLAVGLTVVALTAGPSPLSASQSSPVPDECRGEAGTIGQLECALVRQPDDAEARQRLGNAYFEAGRWFEALEQYEHGLRLAPGNETIRLRIAAVFLEAGLADEAEQTLATGSDRSSVSGGPEYNELYFRLAEVYADRGRLGDARRAMEAAAGHRGPIDPVTIYTRLGDFLTDLIEPAAAAEAYAQALELDPDDLPATLALAALDLEEGRLDEALEGYRRVLSRNPEAVEAHYGMAEARLGAGRFSEAASAARRAVELAPEAPGPHYVLGRALRLAGQDDEGVRELATYRRLQESVLAADHREREVHAYQSEAFVLFYRGDTDGAVAVLQEGLVGHDDEPELYLSLGLILSESGRHSAAVETYSKLLDLGSEAAERAAPHLARERRLAGPLR